MPYTAVLTDTAILYDLPLELPVTTIFALPVLTPVTVTVAPPVAVTDLTVILAVFDDVTVKVSLNPEGDIVSATVAVAPARTLTVETTELFTLAVTSVIEIALPSVYV